MDIFCYGTGNSIYKLKKIKMGRKPFDLYLYSWKATRTNRFPKIFIKKQTQWSNDKIIELSYRKVSWVVSVSQICSPLTNHDILLSFVQ